MRAKGLFISLCAVGALAACGGVAVAPSPTVSCESRGCNRALDEAASALACPASSVLVRDLGVERYRGTGCGHTVVLDCGQGCSPVEPIAPVTPRSEVAYRAGFELLCAPSAVEVAEEGDDAFVASCRGVGVRYTCRGSCRRVGPVDPASYALRQLEPEALECLSRSRADLRVSFDSRGHVVRVDADGIRPVRMRGFERDREAAETKQECIRDLFDRLGPFPDKSGSDVVVALGGPGARRPEQISVLAPPAEPARPRPDATIVASVEPTTPPPPPPTTTVVAPRPEQDAAEAALRAAIDARRDAILACTGTERATLELHPMDDGRVAVALRGPLAGSAEEGCIRSALGGLERPSGLRPGVVVHLVEAAASTPP